MDVPEKRRTVACGASFDFSSVPCSAGCRYVAGAIRALLAQDALHKEAFNRYQALTDIMDSDHLLHATQSYQRCGAALQSLEVGSSAVDLAFEACAPTNCRTEKVRGASSIIVRENFTKFRQSSWTGLDSLSTYGRCRSRISCLNKLQVHRIIGSGESSSCR